MRDCFQNRRPEDSTKDSESKRPRVIINNFNDIGSDVSSPTISKKKSKFPIIKNLAFKEKKSSDSMDEENSERKVKNPIKERTFTSNKVLRHKVQHLYCWFIMLQFLSTPKRKNYN